jgi:hypothetical protein
VALAAMAHHAALAANKQHLSVGPDALLLVVVLILVGSDKDGSVSAHLRIGDIEIPSALVVVVAIVLSDATHRASQIVLYNDIPLIARQGEIILGGGKSELQVGAWAHGWYGSLLCCHSFMFLISDSKIKKCLPHMADITQS